MKRVLFPAAAIVGLWAAQVSAVPIEITLSTADLNYVGSIVHGVPSGDQAQENWVNRLRTMDTGSIDNTTFTVPAVQTLTRSMNSLVPLPVADFDEKVENNNFDYTKLDLSGFAYILLKYGVGQDANQHSDVWYIGDIDWTQYTITLPGGGRNLSHYALFRSPSVPDGGATIVLLGSVLMGFGVWRSRFGGQ